MKKLSTKIVTVASIFTISTVSNFSLLAQFGGGDGSAASPYEIHNKAHLNLLTDSVNSSVGTTNWSRNKYFKLMNNITDTVRTIIGTNAIRRFEGHFDGNEHKIVLGINSTNASFTGLFGIVGHNSTISNVTVEGYVKGSQARVGGIAGTIGTTGATTTIKNCIYNCDVTGSSVFSSYIGGICGEMTNCYIENCINNGKVSGNIDIGGIVGIGGIGSIKNCTNTGEISSSIQTVGGIAGDCSGTIENCINSGRISGNNFVGGIIGSLDATTANRNDKIIGCLNIGDIKGNDAVGGIISSAVVDNAEISNCENHGLVVGNDLVGGILGYLQAGTVSNCINGNVVEGKTKNVGCIVGKKNGGTVINNHYDMQMCNEEK